MQRWRLNLVLIFFILFSLGIVARLVSLQIINQEFYQALARGQQNIFKNSMPPRKEIFLQDKDGNLYPLAVNKEFPLVYALPQEIEDKETTAEILAKTLALDKTLILEKISSAGSLYQTIKNKLTKEEKARIRELNLKGIYLQTELVRYYPQQELASQTIGFLGFLNGHKRGQYGLEGYYDELLANSIGDKSSLRSNSAFSLSSKNLQPGKLIVTLDYYIQSAAEKLLADWQSRLSFQEGEILVMEPSSGKILALATLPNFNPNFYEKESDLSVFQNSTLQKIFEPGSVFKPITMAAALETNKITPETTYQDKGWVKIGGYTIYNYGQKAWGEQTMTEVLEKSINTGAVFVEQRIGHKVFLDYLEKFGFFEPTGIDLQGEVFSKNSELKKGREINFATASFGQGIEVTSLQIARAFSAIANNGYLVRPYLLQEVREGNKTLNIEELLLTSSWLKPTQKQILSQKTTSQLKTMLVSVVENGFAKTAQIPGYFIAGKTGTAQVSFAALGQNRRGYSDKTVQTFVGFAPAFSPRFLILVKLNNPQTKTAEYSAAPIFRELAKYIIDYWQIPPDY